MKMFRSITEILFISAVGLLIYVSLEYFSKDLGTILLIATGSWWWIGIIDAFCFPEKYINKKKEIK